VRAGMKADNPKYSLLDDIIFFTGVPLGLGLCAIDTIILAVCTNLLDISLLDIAIWCRMSNFIKIMIIALFCWIILGEIILAVRGAKGRKH